MALMRLMAAVALLTVAAYGQNGGTIEVRCLNVRDFSARLWPPGDQAESDGSSMVQFRELAAGQYRLGIVADGYVAKDSLLVLGAGECQIVETLLQRVTAVLPAVTIETMQLRPADIHFDREQIERSAARDVAEFLSRAGNLDIVSDGVAGASANVRIGGSNTNQVLVLLDGRRIQDAGSGTADLASIPIDWVERIEIYRGGRPDLGAEAIGGIVQVVTRNPGTNGGLDAQVTLRDTDQRFGISREGKISNLGTLVAYSRLQGPNDFRYRISEDDGVGEFTPELGQYERRSNARVTRDQLLAKLSNKFGGLCTATVMGMTDRATRGMPGYLAPYLTPEAEQQNEENAINAEALREQDRQTWKVRGSFEHRLNHYRNGDPYALVAEHREISRSMEAEIRGQSSVRSNILQYGGLAGLQALDGDNLPVGGVSRNRYAGWGTWQRSLAKFGQLNIQGSAGLRWEEFGRDETLLPRTDLSLVLAGRWELGVRAGWGESYRAPDFQALFWQDDQLAAGNPDLKAERSNEWTANLHLENREVNRTRLEWSGSSQRVEDLIYWKRTFENQWKPFNLKDATVRTMGISAGQSLAGDRITVRAGADWTEARNATDDRNTAGRYLTFRPLNTQRVSVEFADQKWRGEVSYRRVSKRPALESNSKWLRAYQIVDARVSYRVRLDKTEIEPAIGVENMFAEVYRIVRFAPMPLAQWYLNVRIKSL